MRIFSQYKVVIESYDLCYTTVDKISHLSQLSKYVESGALFIHSKKSMKIHDLKVYWSIYVCVRNMKRFFFVVCAHFCHESKFGDKIHLFFVWWTKKVCNNKQREKGENSMLSRKNGKLCVIIQLSSLTRDIHSISFCIICATYTLFLYVQKKV